MDQRSERLTILRPREPDRPRARPEPVSVRLRQYSGLRVSHRAFLRLCVDNPDLRLERSSRGELIVMAPAGTESGGRNARLTMRLGIWAEANGTGEHFDSSTGYVLPNGAIRSPDASWIRRDRWEAINPEQRRGFAPICPDFVVELMSPSDTRDDVRTKMREYLAQGVRLGWLLDPDAHEVDVYRSGQPLETLTRPAALSGEDVLPGFVLNLKGILFD